MPAKPQSSPSDLFDPLHLRPGRGGLKGFAREQESKLDYWLDEIIAKNYPRAYQFIKDAALPGQNILDAWQHGEIDFASLAPILISEAGPQPILPVGTLGLSAMQRILLAEFLSTAAAYALTGIEARGLRARGVGTGGVVANKPLAPLTEASAGVAWNQIAQAERSKVAKLKAQVALGRALLKFGEALAEKLEDEKDKR